MSSAQPPVCHAPASHAVAKPVRLRQLALAAGILAALLSVASVFCMQAGWPASWHAWRHADAGLAMIALGTLVAGALLAFCTSE